MWKCAGNMKHDHSNYLHVGINCALLSGPQAQMVENNRQNIPLGATYLKVNHTLIFVSGRI